MPTVPLILIVRPYLIQNIAFFILNETMKLIKLKRQIRRLAKNRQKAEDKTRYNQLNNFVSKQR